ncbi:MAG TPA: sialidase family protein [Thermoplasmata archaeon]|nr:sialidase family protein [Thermoplasmata archaeon]
MASEPGSGRVRLGVKLAIATALFVLVVSVLPLGFASGSSVPSAPNAVAGGPHPGAVLPRSSPVASAAAGDARSSSALPHPSTATGTIQYYGNTSGFAVPAYNNEGCQVYAGTTYQDNYCYPQAVDPTLMTLGNGNVGLSYQFDTNASGSTCSSRAADAHTEIGFSISTNSGASFGSPVVIANQTCAYLQSIEPSFTTSGNSVYGVFVEENDTATTPTYYGTYGASRPGDALGFSASSNNGVSFSVPRTLVTGGNITHPEMTAVGKTLYVVYENLSTSATTVPIGGPFCYGFCYPAVPPAAIEYLYSTDGGTTWTGPTALPGLNATLNGFSINAALAVNATGTVAVSYFTNGSCVQNTLYGCMDWGLDLVLLTSTTNGSTWKGPYTVAPQVGISSQYFGYFYPETGYWVPQDQLLFDAAGTTVDIAFSGLYNKSYASNYINDWCCAGIFFATGSVSGGSFSITPIYTSYDSAAYDDMFNPSIGLHGGTLYISWTWNNETYCYTGCDYLTGTLNQRLVTSTDAGTTWSDPFIVAIDKGPYSGCTSACATQQTPGYQSSIGFAGSTPLVAYSFPEDSSYASTFYGGVSYYNVTNPTILSVASPYTGPTVVLNVTENNLIAGTTWTFTVQGLTYSTTGKSFLITNVPQGQPVTVSPNNIAAAYGEQVSPMSSVAGIVNLAKNATVFFNYTLQFQLLFFEMPLITPYMQVYFAYNGTQAYFYSDWYCYTGACNSFREWCTPTYTCSTGTPESWWYPEGAVIHVYPYAYSNAQNTYWNGTGSGNFTGSGSSFNITMDGAINETGWIGGFGLFNVTVNAMGLPSTSTYSFTFNGNTYSAPATSAVTVANVANGPYDVSAITATSSTSGWEYFGTPTPANPVIIPAEPIINLTFEYIDVAAAPGTVSFHAVGLTAGTAWHFSFNGTEYSSVTPWINVTAHPGTYSTAAYPVVSANGSAGYTPSGVPASWSVTTGGSPYDVTYAPAFQTVVTAGIGGTIAGSARGTLWEANGASVAFHAVASSGYEFGGWTGKGLNAYSGSDSWANYTVAGPTLESASFFPLPQDRFNLTFQETGLAPGTLWTVYLSGQGYSTTQPVLQVHNLYPCGPLGTYNLSIPYAYVNGSQLTRYAPGGYHATTCTMGSTMVPVTFSPQYYLSLGATPGGFAEAEVGSNIYSNSTWVQNGTSVLLVEVALAGFEFLGWNGTGAGSYTGPTVSVGLVMANPMSEIAAFAKPYVAPPPRFWVDFHLSVAFASGTAWIVRLESTGYSTTGTDLNITGLNATPSASVLVLTAYSPDGLTRYSPLGAPTGVPVTHNVTLTLSYATSYWVSVTANYGGAVAKPTSNPGGSWVAAGLPVVINATANDGYVFLGWTGTGTGSYTGSVPEETMTVKGPIHEVASFAPAAPAATVVTSSIWSAPLTWIGLAAVGLLVGLVVGLLVGRRGGGGPRPAVSDAPWSEDPGMMESPPEPSGDSSSDAEGA